MATFDFVWIAWFSAILSAVCGSVDDVHRDEVQTDSFDVKPGAGRQEYSTEWGEFECSFSYKAQGGTKEQWLLTMTRDSAHSAWTCTAERPGGQSYLFFEEFTLQVKGAQLQQVTAEKEAGVVLDSSEYVIVKDKNYVQQSDAKFHSQLTRVQIYATRSASRDSREL